MSIREFVAMNLVAAGSYAAHFAIRSKDFRFTQDFVSEKTTSWMRHLGEFRDRPGVRALEIGCYEGRSTIWFLQNILTHPTSAITCVDTFTSRRAEVRFDHNVAISGSRARVTKIGGKSQEVLALFKSDSYDFIYVDGGHRADDVRADASLCWPLLKRGGVIIFDDYLWHPEKPAEDRPQVAVDEFLREHASQLALLHQEYQVIARRTG